MKSCFRNSYFIVCVVLLLLVTLSLANAEPTKVRVRVIAQDAKVIGSGVGGVRVTIRDVVQDEILGEAIQRGGTGDTNLIMKTPYSRHSNRFPKDNAAFAEFNLDLNVPTVVDITAEGPLGFPQSIMKSSKRILLLPGKDIGGEGILLTLHGFIVDIMSPESIDAFKEGDEIPVKASVRMMCGCPTQPGGLWDSDTMKIEAVVLMDGKIVETQAMKYTGKVDVYEGTLHAPVLNDKSHGGIEIMVLVSQPDMANFGMDKMALHVRAK